MINIKILKKVRVFNGIEEEDLYSMIKCLNAREVSYQKNTYIFHAGDKIFEVGIVINGAVHITDEDFWGKKTIISVIENYSLFGEVYSMSESGISLVNVVAACDTDIIFIDINKILKLCSNSCKFHYTMIKNLLRILSERNLTLIQKIGYLSKPTTREKLLSYLSFYAKKQGKSSFDIPLNRNQMAEYLSIDRSAMSRELCRMRDEKILSFEKNHFELYDKI